MAGRNIFIAAARQHRLYESICGGRCLHAGRFLPPIRRADARARKGSAWRRVTRSSRTASRAIGAFRARPRRRGAGPTSVRTRIRRLHRPSRAHAGSLDHTESRVRGRRPLRNSGPRPPASDCPRWDEPLARRPAGPPRHGAPAHGACPEPLRALDSRSV